MVKKQINKNTGRFSGKSAERSQSKEGEQNEKNLRKNKAAISRKKTNFFDGFHQRGSISIQKQVQIHEDSFHDQYDCNNSQEVQKSLSQEVHSGRSEVDEQIRQYEDKKKEKQDVLRHRKYGQNSQSQLYNQKRERNNLQQTGIKAKQKIQFNDKTLKKQIIRDNKSYLKLLKQKKCQACREKRLPEYEYSQIMLCDICDDAYHRACLQFPLSIEEVRNLRNWLCPQCAKSYFLNENHVRKINHEMSSEQFQHCQHIDSDQFPTDFSLYSEAMLMLTFEQNKNKRLTDLEKSFWTQRQHQWFKLQAYKPIKQEAICRQKYWIPLIRVLSQYSLFYCPFQVYPNYQIMSLNMSRNHRPNIAQMLSTKDEKAFEEFLESVQNGDAPPLTLDKCPFKGYLVRALKRIAAKTIICEYAGEVMTYRQSLRDCVNDSIFNLLETGNSSTTLQIVPRKYANISKYFLGINNSELQNYNKINVQSILFSYKGRNRIIFYTLREVEKGQALYINYNGGISHDYPTQNFE